MQLLTDTEVEKHLTAPLAVEAARRAVRDASAGRLAGPPRLRADVGTTGLVFTAGGYQQGPLGFRVYGLWSGSSDQAVLVWGGSGELRGVIVGRELGIRRTGALGAVAVDALARAEATRVGVIGSGAQAWAQLWAMTAVRTITHVSIFSPTPAHRSAFAARAQTQLGLRAEPVDDAARAARGADILVIATRSLEPVVDPSWVERGAHVNTIGPKTLSGHELPAEVAERASLVVSDAPHQASAYDEPFFTPRRLVHLGEVIETGGRTGDDEVTLYCSTGLAGSEVVIADALLAAVSRG